MLIGRDVDDVLKYGVPPERHQARDRAERSTSGGVTLSRSSSSADRLCCIRLVPRGVLGRCSGA